MVSSVEAELSTLLFNAQDVVPMRTAFIDKNHTQPPTPIQVDNSAALGISNGK